MNRLAAFAAGLSVARASAFTLRLATLSRASIRPPQLIENRGYLHIPPFAPASPRIVSPELAYFPQVSCRPKVATPK